LAVDLPVFKVTATKWRMEKGALFTCPFLVFAASRVMAVKKVLQDD